MTKRTVYLNPYPQPQIPPGYEVITPTNHAAKAVNAPERSLESLALSVVNEANLQVATALIASQILRAATREVFDLGDAETAARGLKPSLQTLLRTNADLKALAYVGSSRVQKLVRVVENYRAQLRERNLVDQSEVLWRAVECNLTPRKIYVYGYFRPRIDELSFADAIGANGSAFGLPCSEDSIFSENREAVELLSQRGWQVEREERAPSTIGERLSLDFTSESAKKSDVPVHAYPHVEAEVRGVLAQIKSKLINGTPPDEIALVVRDDAFYGPVVSSVAWEYGLPVRTLYAVPLNETRIGTWVRLLFEVILNKLPFEATARLLAQPLGPGLPDKQWAAVRARHPTGLARWQALGINLAPLATLPQQDTRDAWIQHLQQLLSAFDIGSRVGSWSREVLAYYTLQSELSALAEPSGEVLTKEGFAAEVIELLALLTVPAQPGTGGIELHTPLTLFGTRQAHLYVMGMAEGTLPAMMAEDAVLDFHERHKLAKLGFELETAADSARREALSFYALLQTATETITLSYPRTMQGRETIPSPYFASLGIDVSVTTAMPILPASSPEEARRILLRHDDDPNDPVLTNARRAFAVERGRESANVQNEYDGVTGKPYDFTNHVWSSSQLTKLGQCPFGWFSQYVMKLAEVEEAQDTLSPATKGNLYHKVLEIALRPVTRAQEPLPSSSVRSVVLDNLEAALRRVEKEMGLTILPAWDAQRKEHLAVLRRAVTGVDFIKDGAVALASEQKFEGEWYGLKIKGIVDRIDRTADGVVLVDYKSGASLTPGPKDMEGKTRLDIQLPIYVHVAGSSLYGGEPVADAYYYSLSKSRIIKKSLGGDSAVLETFIERIKNHLNDGHFAVEPDAERNACAYCEYDLVCRKGARLERKGEA